MTGIELIEALVRNRAICGSLNEPLLLYRMHSNGIPLKAWRESDFKRMQNT
jgi:hypothetical protein